jgi:hypothetical protein
MSGYGVTRSRGLAATAKPTYRETAQPRTHETATS